MNISIVAIRIDWELKRTKICLVRYGKKISVKIFKVIKRQKKIPNDFLSKIVSTTYAFVKSALRNTGT